MLTNKIISRNDEQPVWRICIQDMFIYQRQSILSYSRSNIPRNDKIWYNMIDNEIFINWSSLDEAGSFYG